MLAVNGVVGQVSMRLKLMVMVGVGLLATIVTGVIGVSQLSYSAQLADELTGLQKQTRVSLEADMGHDAVRSDVLSAALLGKTANATELRAALAEHSAALSEGVATFVAPSVPAEVRKAALAVQPSVQTYVKTAATLVDRALTLPPGALDPAALDESFEAVEELMPAVGDALEAVAKDVDEKASGARTVGLWEIVIASVIGALLMVAIGALVLFDVQAALARLSQVAQGLSRGDLTARSGLQRKDEIGVMAAQFDEASANLAKIMVELAGAGQSLATAATQLTSTADQANTSAAAASGQAIAARESASEVDSSVQSVMAGAEEMSASVSEIATSASRAASVAAESVSAVEAATGQITQLGSASAEIGGVVKLITAIAEQTNLLALNATIEAARAGEAGKGFAVVAEEVKQLAQETARATGDITSRISSLQDASVAAAEAVEGIRVVIGQINEFNMTIASAVEEQAATTNSMAQSLGLAAAGSSSMTRAVDDVANVNERTADSIQESRDAAQAVSSSAYQLNGVVSQFRY